jgi:hypothetical protein
MAPESGTRDSPGAAIDGYVPRVGPKTPHADQRNSGQRKGLLRTDSGFGAHRVLASEAGLHIFEPSEGEAGGRLAARVRIAVVPLGDVPAAKLSREIFAALAAQRPNTVIRCYREQPPLVREAGGKWRTGRLDLVLGGEFDLLQDHA